MWGSQKRASGIATTVGSSPVFTGNDRAELNVWRKVVAPHSLLEKPHHQ